MSGRGWEDGAGILTLPDGRTVRGRALRHPLPPGEVPDFGLYLLGKPPPATPWPSRWLRWPDFRLPTDRAAARAALVDVHERCATERIEIACAGGRGRTGTALACLTVIAGIPAEDAVAYVRTHYDAHAVETPGQRRYVRRFG